MISARTKFAEGQRQLALSAESEHHRWRAQQRHHQRPPLKTPLIQLTSSQARKIWLHAQRLDVAEPFGSGPAATLAAIAHLGYLQIDTIYVIERSHHHILFTRIPSYRREHLHQAQGRLSVGKYDMACVQYSNTDLSTLSQGIVIVTI